MDRSAIELFEQWEAAETRFQRLSLAYFQECIRWGTAPVGKRLELQAARKTAHDNLAAFLRAVGREGDRCCQVVVSAERPTR